MAWIERVFVLELDDTLRATSLQDAPAKTAEPEKSHRSRLRLALETLWSSAVQG